MKREIFEFFPLTKHSNHNENDNPHHFSQAQINFNFCDRVTKQKGIGNNRCLFVW